MHFQVAKACAPPSAVLFCPACPAGSAAAGARHRGAVRARCPAPALPGDVRCARPRPRDQRRQDAAGRAGRGAACSNGGALSAAGKVQPCTGAASEACEGVGGRGGTKAPSAAGQVQPCAGVVAQACEGKGAGVEEGKAYQGELLHLLSFMASAGLQGVGQGPEGWPLLPSCRCPACWRPSCLPRRPCTTALPSPPLPSPTLPTPLPHVQVPGMLEAQLLAARALYLNGNLDAAQRKAADILRVTPDAYMVHLLICR